MSTKYFALLTQLGADKLANAAALGTKIEITHMAVGDGGGSLPVPDTKQTKLINEKRRAAINTLSIDPKNTNQIIAEQVIPEAEGGWWIREIGLYDKDGVLVAVGNCAETYKPQLQEGSGRTQTIRMILIVSSANAVTLKVDPSIVLATREYVDNSITKHANSRNHPDATLKEKGFVILSSAVDSNSETHAATPKAVKAAYDLANAANNNANTRVPSVRKVNGKALSADISLNSADVGAYNKAETDARVNEAKAQAKVANDNANGRVPAARKVNGKTLSADISLNSADVGAYNKAETDARVNEAKAQANAASDNANTRLEKNKNGADIPNKDEFVKNLGLTETKTKADNALSRSGGQVTGDLTITTDSEIAWRRNTDMAAIGFKNTGDGDPDSYMWFKTADNGNEYFKWQHSLSGGETNEWMSLKSDNLRVKGHPVYHEGNKPTVEEIQAEPRFNKTIDLTGLSTDRYYPVWWRFPSNDGANSWLTIHRWYAEDREKDLFNKDEFHISGLLLQIEGGDALWGGDAHYLNIKRIHQRYRNTVKNIRYGMMSVARPIDGKYPLYGNVKSGDIVDCSRLSGCYLRGGLTYHVTSNFSDIHYSRKDDEFEISRALEPQSKFEIKWMVKSYAIDDPILGEEYADIVTPYSYDFLNMVYPVGIVSWFAQNKNPNVLFPKTQWKYIGENKTIRLANQNGSNVLSAGGNDSITLTGTQIPPHNHSFSATTSNFDYGTKTTNSSGNHFHDSGWGEASGARYGTYDSTSNNVGSARTDYDNYKYKTSTEGAHIHTMHIGAHTHTVSGTTGNTGSSSAVNITNSYIMLMGWYRIS